MRDDVTFIYPGEVPQSGTFKGKDAVEHWFRNYFSQFPRIQFDIKNICFENIFDLTGTNVAAVHWHLQLTNRDGQVSKFGGVTMFDIKGGKAFLIQDFHFDLGENFKRIWSVM